MKHQVLVIDRYELVHVGISAILDSRDHCVMLPHARSWQAAARYLATQSPDLIILDPFQTENIGILPSLRGEYVTHRLLVLTDNDDPDDIRMAINQGVDGYVLKNIPIGDLENAIDSLLQGRKFLHPNISHALVGPRNEHSLTRRQEEVLTQIAQGRTMKQIAASLGISAKTVESHRVTLMNRLGVHHIAGLVHYAIRHGYVQLSASATRNTFRI